MVTRIEAGKAAGKWPARYRSASTPPAEVPIARMSRLLIDAPIVPITGTPRATAGSEATDKQEKTLSVYTVRLSPLRTKAGKVNSSSAKVQRDHPPMVVMGASAGGIKALQQFFDAMPADTGATFVVVVHLDPEHRSELPAILAARTKMPVVQVDRRLQLTGGRVYVIPPDRRLQLIDHEIIPLAFEEPRGHRSPIDSLLRSVAERMGDGFAVIFSGA